MSRTETHTPPRSDLSMGAMEIVVLTGAGALIQTLGRKKAERFIRDWASRIARQEAVSRLLPDRSASSIRARSRDQEDAAAWMRENIPALLASLPLE